MGARRYAQNIVGILPISYYPVTREWKRPRITTSVLAVVSVVIYACLTVWNLLTQGHESVYTSTFLSSDPHRRNTQCDVVTLNVGQSLYTSPNGTFPWDIASIDSPSMDGIAVGFPYTGTPLGATLINFSFTYYWVMQSFAYSVCANVSSPTLIGTNTGLDSASAGATGATYSVATDNGTPLNTTVTMCTHFDLASSYVSAWTDEQMAIQESFFDMAVYYQNLTFPDKTFPECRFPPYCDPRTNLPPPADTTITPHDVYATSAWLFGVRVLPATTGVNYTTMGVPLGPGHVVEVVATEDVTDLVGAFEATYNNGTGPSGLTLGVAGIGGVRLGTSAANIAEGFEEPSAVAVVRNYTLGIINIIADAAIKDLDGRPFAASYFCTTTTSRWKPVSTLVALVLGNNAALFSVFLALAVAVARHLEIRVVRGEIEPFRGVAREDTINKAEGSPMMQDVSGYPSPSTPDGPNSRYYPDRLRELLRDGTVLY